MQRGGAEGTRAAWAVSQICRRDWGMMSLIAAGPIILLSRTTGSRGPLIRGEAPNVIAARP